ncbi:MAG: tripartite tricarboxylate transporter substrate binding protein [Betaproteobacteria bacterium]|nr:tripartite tricarboxylate transporter substrate binding protein [Betaproteobacteria bacterium]
MVVRKTLFGGALVVCVMPMGAHAADAAQNYPTKPIRIIIGFTPGGGPDITARYLAPKLTEAFKQQVIVDNRPGAGGTVGANLVATSNPDGYTLLSVSSAHAVAAAIYPKLPYDTRKDFSGITQTAVSKYLLLAAPALGVKSLKDLIAMAKAKPGALNFSSAGVGSGTHFAGEQFKAAAGINVVHVPYKGIPEALTETISGRVQLFMSPIANAINLVKEGRAVGLGVSSPRRDALLPDMPTLAEAGLPGFRADLWFGLLTSAQAPKVVVAKLNAEVRRILTEAEVKTRWSPIGLEPVPTTPAAFDKIVADEIASFAAIARAANIKAE